MEIIDYYDAYISNKGASQIRNRLDEYFPAEKWQVKQNILSYIVNLQTFDGVVRICRDRNWPFHSRWHTYRYALRAQELMEEMGWVTIQIGYRNPTFEEGLPSIMKGTDLLFAEFGEPVETLDIDHDYSEETLITIDDDPYPDEVSLRQLRAFGKDYIEQAEYDLTVINEWYAQNVRLQNTRVKMAVQPFLVRRFKDGANGRLYAVGSHSYMNLPHNKKDKDGNPFRYRDSIFINGESTVELDFSALHITMLYHQKGLEVPQNPYDAVVVHLIGREDDGLKAAVKCCVMRAINASTEEKYRLAMNDCREEQIWEAQQTMKQFGFDQMDVLKALKEVHKDIEFHSNAGVHLMLEDSNMMVEILKKLIEHNLHGVPLHDAILCISAEKEEVFEIMSKTYEDIFRFKIKVSDKTSKGTNTNTPNPPPTPTPSHYR